MKDEPIVSDMSKSNGGTPLILTSKDGFEREQESLKLAQEEVEKYNRETEAMSDIPEPIKNRSYVNGNIVVKLFKEDHARIAKTVTNQLNSEPLLIKSISKIAVDVPSSSAYGSHKIVDNPLPYLFEGVVVAMDPKINENSNLSAKLEVGNIIQMISFDLKSDRYYPFKNQRDLVTMDDYSFSNYEGYALVSASMIESISTKRFIG